MRVFFIGFGQAGGKIVDMFIEQDKKLGTNSFRGIAVNTARTDLMGLKNIVVLNDEAHHCYRAKVKDAEGDTEADLKGDEKDEAKRNNEAARLWITGLETVKRKLGVATVFDLLCANYGLDRGLGGACAKNYEQNIPYTPAWQESITGVKAADVITVARQFADNADKTHGKSMVIIGAAMNHWYHCDMNYRGVINMLVMCGCVGQSGGGWSHYVGQEKLRPQSGWLPLAFALDWGRPPRQQNSTSFFYAHTDQWRYEKLGMDEILSPLADASAFKGSAIDHTHFALRWPQVPEKLKIGFFCVTKKCRTPAEKFLFCVKLLVNFKPGF